MIPSYLFPARAGDSIILSLSPGLLIQTNLSTKLPLGIRVENMVWSLFFKGFAHVVDFLARAYDHPALGHGGRQLQVQRRQQ